MKKPCAATLKSEAARLLVWTNLFERFIEGVESEGERKLIQATLFRFVYLLHILNPICVVLSHTFPIKQMKVKGCDVTEFVTKQKKIIMNRG